MTVREATIFLILISNYHLYGIKIEKFILLMRTLSMNNEWRVLGRVYDSLDLEEFKNAYEWDQVLNAFQLIDLTNIDTTTYFYLDSDGRFYYIRDKVEEFMNDLREEAKEKREKALSKEA